MDDQLNLSISTTRNSSPHVQTKNLSGKPHEESRITNNIPCPSKLTRRYPFEPSENNPVKTKCNAINSHSILKKRNVPKEINPTHQSLPTPKRDGANKKISSINETKRIQFQHNCFNETQKQTPKTTTRMIKQIKKSIMGSLKKKRGKETHGHYPNNWPSLEIAKRIRECRAQESQFWDKGFQEDCVFQYGKVVGFQESTRVVRYS